MRSSPALRRIQLLGMLVLPALGLGPGCGGEGAVPGAGQAASAAAEGYPATGGHALFQGGENRQGGSTGGFGDDLGFADFTYRLGTTTRPVPVTEIEALLAAHGSQIRLTGDHMSALSRALGERPAFAAWSQFLADGGRLRPFTPLEPQELAEIAPSRVVLAGDGRYIPDRLLIIARSDEPELEEFLFHEIQHYIFDKWDSAPFEAGEADHKIIGIIEERRSLIESIREGRMPTESNSVRVLNDRGGAATEALLAGRWVEAVEHVRSRKFYRDWVDVTIQRVRARNENKSRVRIVSTMLSNGTTLLIDERSDRESPDDIRAQNGRVPPDYRFGPVVYASVRNIHSFDEERLFLEGHVPEDDRALASEFLRAHREDWGRGRGHIFSEAEMRDIAHLSAYSAAILQQALGLADSLRPGPEVGLEEVMRGDRYQDAFSEFLRRYVDRMADGQGTDPRAAAEQIARIS